MPSRAVSRASVLACLLLLLAPGARGAETTDPVRQSTTRIAIALGAPEAIPVRASFEPSPPTIEIRFPRQRVTASLPEHVAMAGGAVQALDASYDPAGRDDQRFIRALRFVLAGPFTYRVQSEPGRVIIEIDHPDTVRGATVDIGMGSGRVVRNTPAGIVSERFRAMQEALSRARPATVSMYWAGASTAPLATGPDAGALPPAPAGAALAGREPRAGSQPASGGSPTQRFPALGLTLLIALAAAGAAGSWWIIERQAAAARASSGRNVRLPSGVLLIDQLVWKAFERQGYQLTRETELTQPALGTLRILAKDGAASALLFVGSGRFFEKQTVERFAQEMREAKVTQGFLAASGSFTVPAQRLAKEHQISLIGRDQLVELLSMGAGTEYFSRQLEQNHARLEEAKETVRQHAAELDALRRQRNEASWQLGEERAKSANLLARLEEFDQEISGYTAQIQRWEQEAIALRKQWEESQWFLGESRERNRYLEAQVASLQEMAARLETAERERDSAGQSLSAERQERASLEGRLDQLQQELKQTAQRSAEFEASLARLQDELAVYQKLGDRRRTGRVRIREASVELVNEDHAPLAGWLSDLSLTGLGLETDRELSDAVPVRMRVRLPGSEPLEAKARMVWQRAEPSSGRYRSGYRFVRRPAATRAALQALLSQHQAPSA